MKDVNAYAEQFYNPVGSGEDGESGEEHDENEEETDGSPEVQDDEGVSEEVDTARKRTPETVRKYEVIGTAMDKEYPSPEDVVMIVKHERDRDSMLRELMKCGLIVYDITQDSSQIAEARWALEAIGEELQRMAEERPKAFKRSQEVRHFILISTVMTWALSKPLYAEDPDLPFTEADYRKRRPHANFKEHTQCEKEVVMMKKFLDLKGKLKTIVLCCGVTYGDEEGPFHYLFKMAWNNAPELPIFGKGTNKIPLLHVRNIPMIVLMFLRDWPKLPYVVAVEHVRMSQKTIVKKISNTLSTGNVKNIPPEEAFLLNDVTQQSYDMITLNLNIEPAYLADQDIEWYTLLPFSANITNIAKEYKEGRNLHPVKIVVLGPPASGKSRLALKLAEYYKIHYVHVKSLITETINKLTNDIEVARNAERLVDADAAATDEGGGGDDADDDEDVEYNDVEEEEPEGVEVWEEQLDEIRRNLSENQGRLEDGVLNRIFLKKLTSKECQNQGYVLDGYPKTLSQAKGLFGDEEGNENEEEEETATGFRKKIIPELVVVLTASDEFLIERLLTLSETVIQGTHYEEEQMLRRFREYRERESDDVTPLQFFDEIEVHPLFISVEDDPCPDMFPSFNICLKKIGRARNYGPTKEELAEYQKRAEAEAKAAEAIEKELRVVEELNRKTRREQKMIEWTNLLENLKEEEENQLRIMGEPLRHYLVKYVFPTLTQGLVKVAELRPEDPVDYLAEYLFKENPEGKMFEPDYTETMSMLLAAIEELQKDILPIGELEEGEKEYLKPTRRISSEGKDDDEVTFDCSYDKTYPKSQASKLYDPKKTESFEGE